MKKNILLKFIVFSVILILSLGTFSLVNATSIIPSNVGPGLEGVGDTPQIMANTLIGILKWIGYVIAIGMVIFVGIKYTMASADEKANMKGVLVKVVIGALIIVFANTIVNIVLGIAMANG